SVNCMVASAWFRPNSARLSAKVMIDTSRAKLRACGARSSPKNRVSAPPAIGSQISRLSRGHEENIPLPCRLVAELRQHREQCDQAEDHGEGVVVQVAGLDPARHRGDAVDDPGGAIDEDAIDDAAVADARGQVAEGHAALCEALDPQV